MDNQSISDYTSTNIEDKNRELECEIRTIEGQLLTAKRICIGQHEEILRLKSEHEQKKTITSNCSHNKNDWIIQLTQKAAELENIISSAFNHNYALNSTTISQYNISFNDLLRESHKQLSVLNSNHVAKYDKIIETNNGNRSFEEEQNKTDSDMINLLVNRDNNPIVVNHYNIVSDLITNVDELNSIVDYAKALDRKPITAVDTRKQCCSVDLMNESSNRNYTTDEQLELMISLQKKIDEIKVKVAKEREHCNIQ